MPYFLSVCGHVYCLRSFCCVLPCNICCTTFLHHLIWVKISVSRVPCVELIVQIKQKKNAGHSRCNVCPAENASQLSISLSGHWMLRLLTHPTDPLLTVQCCFVENSFLGSRVVRYNHKPYWLSIYIVTFGTYRFWKGNFWKYQYRYWLGHSWKYWYRYGYFAK